MGRDILEPRKRRRTPNQNLQPEEEKDPSLLVPPVRAIGERSKRKPFSFVRIERERVRDPPNGNGEEARKTQEASPLPEPEFPGTNLRPQSSLLRCSEPRSLQRTEAIPELYS